MERLVNASSKVISVLLTKGKPAISKFITYAKVEMRPPSVADLTPALAEANRLIAAAKAGKWKNVTTKEGLLNAVVTMEVLAWFFVGEIIGRRSIIGYSRVPGGYIRAH
ncbi:ATP synthase subunit g [Fasciola gigantica]|uniref:ATP synthase subunit g n=1 Tax=Fasciola gigantica TaxID=46835 RepID=A0A504YX86_FASGI|nr:ATP synthase subunit g [Fasciola gigantica]